jgi:hypothetical protein
MALHSKPVKFDYLPMAAGKRIEIGIFILLLLLLQLKLLCQKDTAQSKPTVEGFLQKQKGFIGNLAHNLVNDTHPPVPKGPVNIERIFNQYEGRIIRNIYIQRLDFGTLIEDTANNFSNKFTRLANQLHKKSREYIIRNNLFFKKGDKVVAFLLADNERHLRDQPYIQDVSIFLINVYGTVDSVDVVVRTKDVLSTGGSFQLHNTQSADLSIKEDNLGGGGNSLALSTLFDQNRNKKMGYGIDYIFRNIGGSFIDAYTGYSSFANSYNTGEKSEETEYLRFVRPLVNPYTKWTYWLEGTNHINQNMYRGDSLFKFDYRYQYYTYDAWVGWNTGAYKLGKNNEDDRLRTMLSMRYFKQFFLKIPEKYANQYYFQYADITGVLAAISIFKQNFYKAQYYYGFGINEDVPEGVDFSINAGWVNKQQLNRPYVGVGIERSFFTDRQGYYDFIIRGGTYFNNKRFEDMNVLLDGTHYTRLRYLGSKWKQRSMINASITGQANQVLNAPLSLESSFGLPEWRNSGTLGGDLRSTLKGESVFFSPYTFLNFHFAPFVFGNLCLFTPVGENLARSDLYSSIGAGIRTRNESLIFGTFELKAFYYPRKNFFNESWRIETNTNIKFKYNSQLIKRPELINVN